MISNPLISPVLVPPVWIDSSNGVLDLESPVEQLGLCQFQADVHVSASNVAQVFEQHLLVPGVILQEQGRMIGMLSRQRMLEFLIRPQGLELFLQQPLKVLYSYAQSPTLVISGQTKIVTAARQALRRSPEFQGEPLVVQTAPQTYCLLNVHELNIAYWQIRGLETQVRYERAQAQMIQSEKMASLGRLVDGVAHEILDPVSFIWGNLTHVSTYCQQLLDLLESYETHFPQPPTEISRLQAEIELAYLREDLPQAIASIRGGADRLKQLATSLQTFCHIDDVYPKPADLHECLDHILLLLKERLTGEIEIIRHYTALPPVSCYVGQLSQVFMNILTNAIDALINQAVSQQLATEFGDSKHPAVVVTDRPKPQILITTQIRSREMEVGSDKGGSSRWVSICIADNGPGLSAEQCQQILDTFSVKKRTAKETSLSVSYHIVTAKHGGQLKVRSPRLTADESALPGTEFEILLPLT